MNALYAFFLSFFWTWSPYASVSQDGGPGATPAPPPAPATPGPTSSGGKSTGGSAGGSQPGDRIYNGI